MLTKEVIKVVEDVGFSISALQVQGKHYLVELNQSTPLGEDWWEIIWFEKNTDDSFIAGVYDRYTGFDVDDEVEPYILIRGKHGVPESISDLLEDAKWKQSTLKTLYMKLKGLQVYRKIGG